MSSQTLLSRQEVYRRAKEIQPLPASVRRLLKLVSSDLYSTSDIVEVVQYDPALTGDLLVRANSAESASRTRITEIKVAVNRLGANTVVQTALGRALNRQMSGALPAYGLEKGDMWEHALASSVAADLVLARAGSALPSNLSTAALLHDVGKLVVSACLPPSLVTSLAQTAEIEGRELVGVERDVLGIDHAEVGAIVARSWGMPVSIQVAITKHHDWRDIEDRFALGVALSDRLAHLIHEIDEEADPRELPEAAEAMELMAMVGVEDHQYLPLVGEGRIQYDAIRTAFS
ncbi:MAG: HDOD domain-containing protein [Actinomycetia bacterium]|nr:HDOD domain-containing protein [Actinomycetes bacterium]